MKKSLALMFVLAFVAAAPVMADEISHSNTYGPTGVAFAGLAVPLLKFDPGLGTLTKVTLELDANTDSGSIKWDNEASIPSDIVMGIGAEVTATAPLGLIALTAIPLQSGSGTVAADNDGAADFLGTDSFGITGGSGNDSDSDFTQSSLATFIATFAGETFDTTVDSVVSTYLYTTGGYGPIDSVPGMTDGTITVTYEYVPEPATMSLLAVGAVALLRRRRNPRPSVPKRFDNAPAACRL